MTDRYLFRGKRKDNGELAIGGIYHQLKGDGKDEKLYIVGNDVGCAYEVIPETVGQCTGRKYKNGNLMFDGDIVKDKQSGAYYYIKWFDTYTCFALANRYGRMEFGCDELEIFLNDLVVVGNIHDNSIEELEVNE